MTETVEIEFVAWPKIPRLNREVIVTEKMDGTNAAVGVTDDGVVYAQSRKRIITPASDNFGFAAWVAENSDELRDTLGAGLHFGEWWGRGIQRGYGLDERRFSLFNTSRWTADEYGAYRCVEAPLCHVVPTLSTANAFENIDVLVNRLRAGGSMAAFGFDNPEGVVAFHTASGSLHKVTCENDEKPKGMAA